MRKLKISDATLAKYKQARIRELIRKDKLVPESLREGAGPKQNNLDKKYVRVGIRNAAIECLEPWYGGGGRVPRAESPRYACLTMRVFSQN